MYLPVVHDGSVSAPLTRLLLAAVQESGTRTSTFSAVPEFAPDVLGDDLCPVSTSAVVALWERLTLAGHDSEIGALVAATMPMGSLGVWDYLFAAGENLIETTEQAVADLSLVGDPAAEHTATIHDGRHFTMRHISDTETSDVAGAVEVFAISLYQRRMSEAARRPVAPVRVRFRRRAPRRLGALRDALGTRHIDFGAEHTFVTYLDDDVRMPLPPVPPGLGTVLARHADMTLAAATPVGQWIDGFRVALAAADADGQASLADVAERLAMSPRTVQRRLAENETSWRAELDQLRADLSGHRRCATPCAGRPAALSNTDTERPPTLSNHMRWATSRTEQPAALSNPRH